MLHAVPASNHSEVRPSKGRRRLPTWLKWLLAAGAALVALLVCFMWLVHLVLAPSEPGPALQQAIASRLGVDVNQLSYERMAEHDGCTMVEVSTGHTYQSVAAVPGDAGWVITKVSTDNDHFDLDDPDWERVCSLSR